MESGHLNSTTTEQTTKPFNLVYDVILSINVDIVRQTKTACIALTLITTRLINALFVLDNLTAIEWPDSDNR